MSQTVLGLMNEAERAFGAGHYEAAVARVKAAFDIDPEFQGPEAARFVSSFPAGDRRRYWSASAALFPDREDVAATFGIIYDRAVWGGGSGAGSDLKNTVIYLAYLQHFIERHDVRSIVDLGCGDWRFSKYLRLGECRYRGIDVVPSVIAANQTLFGSETVQFEVGDATRFDLPPCDLLLCKDVLQHLSNANVTAVLSGAKAARWALFTNDYHPANDDCSNGDTRPLDISAPPFRVTATPRLAFQGKVTFLVGA